MKKSFFSAICLFLVLAIVVNITQTFAAVDDAARLTAKGTIFIDPGHGGEDGGAVGINLVMEKGINLSIALLLKELFMGNGYRVVMSREEDVDLGDKGLGSVSERKRSDMRARAKQIEESGADILLSIHQNHFEQSKYRGAQIFYASEQSKTLAETLQETIVAQVQTENNRLAKKIDSVFLLNEARIPAVVVECGFISNREEAELLTTDAYQQQIAEAIYTATVNYLSVA